MEKLKTPCFVVSESALTKNLKILAGVSERTGCKILLAQKAFSMFSVYPLIRKTLCGTSASGLYEARLGAEEFGGENHVFSAAYREEDFDETARLCDHIVFNSLSQLERFAPRAHGKSLGIRVNPECRTQEHEIYDPCARYSRLGVTERELHGGLPEQVRGIHFHTLCEQNSDALRVTLDAVEQRFGKYLSRLDWINFGGGHHITRADYDIATLEECIARMRDKYGLCVYIEPGEAVALDAGFLYAKVLDIVKNEKQTAILDASAACHMPDVLEMPYTPRVTGALPPGGARFDYRLAGATCLAGDTIGEYSFSSSLKVGDFVRFEDMAIYSMVKTNTFNGAPLPCIYLEKADGTLRLVREFSYEDFKSRL